MIAPISEENHNKNHQTPRRPGRALGDNMNEAFIYEAIRTPRGKGKKDGSLHSVKPITLLAGLMRELQSRHNIDTAQIDDVVLGCVTPVGDQGADIAKTAALVAGWD